MAVLSLFLILYIYPQKLTILEYSENNFLYALHNMRNHVNDYL